MKIFFSIKKRFLVDVLIMIVAMVVMMTDQDIKNKDKVGDCNAVDHGDADHGDGDGGHVETSENLIFFW